MAPIYVEQRSVSMRSRQRGATALGMLCIVAIIGFALYGGIRLFPLYMEYMAVSRGRGGYHRLLPADGWIVK